MSNKNKDVNKKYWENNIEGFNKFYDNTSEENIIANPLIKSVYKKVVFPIEKKYMQDRFNFVNSYIEKNVRPGMVVADIGCGGGIFIKKYVQRGAKVLALDYAASALELVKKSLSKEESSSVELMEFDVLDERIPDVDVAISIGVLTYISDIDTYLDHILPFTEKFLFNFLDSSNCFNVVRKFLPALDVRKLTYHNPSDVYNKVSERGFKINSIQKLATGFIVETEANTHEF